jgi:hypothetical protein
LGGRPRRGERQADLLVRHGESIGKLKLGMTLRQARQLLGRERAVNKREKRGKRGHVYLELDWDYGWWTVGFMRHARGAYRAVSIETRQRTQRTREGVGVGSKESRIQRKLAGIRCRSVFAVKRATFLQIECVYGGQRERQTHFLFAPWNTPTPGDLAVAAVAVRDPGFYRAWPVRLCPATAPVTTGRC